VDLEKYDLRQFVFTVPAEMREKFLSREALSWGISQAKKITAKFFGVPVLDRHGHINGYKLEKGVIEYLHVFGDDEPGVFKPHFNIHILEEKGQRLKIESGVLDEIRGAWLKVLKSKCHELAVVDVHYSFTTRGKMNGHRVKYMCRPWSADDYAGVQDDRLKNLLLVEMIGFQYLRFWGAMANCKYRDEMQLSEVKQDLEKKVQEKLIPLFYSPLDFEAWGDRLEEIDDGFYRIKKGGELPPGGKV
jgi:hypothetical protein